jgi:23S rRNA (uracil1939-C5)-methyltransferase
MKSGIRKGQILEVTVNGMDNHGMALYKSGQQTFFFNRAVEGDRVKIRVLNVKNKYGSAELLSVITPSPFRVASTCPDYNRGCGGCQWLHINYEKQLEIKTRIVRDELTRIANMKTMVAKTAGMGETQACRNKMSLLVKNGRVGMTRENSVELIAIGSCLQELPLNRKLHDGIKRMRIPAQVTQIHLRSTTDGAAGVNLYAPRFDRKAADFARTLMERFPEISGAGVTTYGGYCHLAGAEYITQRLGTVSYRIPHNGFFQTNYPQAQALLRFVETFLEPSSKESLLDLYCGGGFFALALAGKYRRVTGIEENANSIKYAVENSAVNGITNTNFFASDAAAGLRDRKTGEFASILLDPPRSGCAPEVLSQVVRLGPKRIVYVSCFPESLARDCTVFLKAGYKVDRIQPVDMFPHTSHVETVVRFVR